MSQRESRVDRRHKSCRLWTTDHGLWTGKNRGLWTMDYGLKWIVLSVLLFVLSGCMPGEMKGEPLKLEKVSPWKGGERSVYAIYSAKSKEEKIGWAKIRVEIKKVEEGKVINWKGEFFSPSKRVSVEVAMREKDLMPIWSKKTIKFSGEKSEVFAQYLPEEVKIKLSSGEKKENVTVSVSGCIYENETLLFILRRLSFSKMLGREKPVSLLTMISQIGQAAPVSLKVEKEKEKVKTPRGEFSCYKVELPSSKEGKQYAWYQDSPPHYLVKYQNSEATYLLR